MNLTTRRLRRARPTISASALRFAYVLGIVAALALTASSAAAAERAPMSPLHPTFDASQADTNRQKGIAQADDGDDHFDEGDDEYEGGGSGGDEDREDDGEDRFDVGDDEYAGSEIDGQDDGTESSDDDFDRDDGENEEAGCRNFDDGEDRCLDAFPARLDDGEDRLDAGDDEFWADPGCGLALEPVSDGSVDGLAAEPAAAKAEAFDPGVPLLVLGAGGLAAGAVAFARRRQNG